MNFKIIEEWCRNNRTTISALEKKCGFGNATIRGWKKSVPRVDKLKKVSEITGISIEELLEVSKKNKSK